MKRTMRMVTKLLSASILVMIFGAMGCNVPDDYNADDAIAASYIVASKVMGDTCGGTAKCEDPNVNCGNGSSWATGGRCWICPKGETVLVADNHENTSCSGGGIIVEDVVHTAPVVERERGTGRGGDTTPTRKAPAGR